MAEAGRIDFDNPTSIDEEEDEETLAAIDEGIRDAEAGRTAPIEEVLKLLPKWIIASSSRKKLRNSLPAVIGIPCSSRLRGAVRKVAYHAEQEGQRIA